MAFHAQECLVNIVSVGQLTVLFDNSFKSTDSDEIPKSLCLFCHKGATNEIISQVSVDGIYPIKNKTIVTAGDNLRKHHNSEMKLILHSSS